MFIPATQNKTPIQQHPTRTAQQRSKPAMIQEVLQRFTSTPEPETEESDYEVSIPSISQRVVSHRQRSNYSTAYIRNTSTPQKNDVSPSLVSPKSHASSNPYNTQSRSQSQSPLARGVVYGYSRPVSPLKASHIMGTGSGGNNTNLAPYVTDPLEEKQKIKEFVDVNKMIRALRTLEQLVSSPEVEFNEFKSEYVSCTTELLDAVQISTRDTSSNSLWERQEKNKEKTKEKESTGMWLLRQQLSGKDTRQESNGDLVLGIFMVSAQIFRLCLEMGTPFVLSAVMFWRGMMKTPFVMQFTELICEIVLILLSVILKLLKSLKKWLDSE